MGHVILHLIRCFGRSLLQPWCPAPRSLSLHLRTPPIDIYTLSLHDALPIFADARGRAASGGERERREDSAVRAQHQPDAQVQDRKSTRLNSSHLGISYAVFCLKKKIRRTSTSAT